jgi:hypothetical protein
VGKARVPLVEVVGQVGVQDSRADLEQEVCAPLGLQRICWFLTIRLAITWLTADLPLSWRWARRPGSAE